MSKMINAMKAALGMRSLAGKGWRFWVMYHNL